MLHIYIYDISRLRVKKSYLCVPYMKVSVFKERKCNPVTRNELCKDSRNIFLPEKIVVNQSVKKFATFYGTRWFITVSQEPVINLHSEPD